MYQLHNKISIYRILTRREIQITRLIAQGYTDKEIARKLCCSYNTIRTHHKNILRKTKQHNIGGLICWAIQNGLTI